MHVVTTTPPAIEPITLAEAKEHLRVSDLTADDDYITALIAAARRQVEAMTGRVLIDTVFTVHVRKWCPWIKLPRGNAHAVSAVVYDDADGVEQTVNSSLYAIRPYGDGCAELVFLDAFTEPALRDEDRIDRIRITFTAGYGDERTDVPGDLLLAVKYLVAHYYDHRSPAAMGVSVAEVPFTVRSLCAPYTIYS